MRGLKMSDKIDGQGWEDDQTYLYFIAAESDMLDQATNALRQNGHGAVANQLEKLQQDLGVEINDSDFDKPASGPESAALRATYERVHPTRAAELLKQVRDLVGDARLKAELQSLMDMLPVAPQAPKQAGPTPHP